MENVDVVIENEKIYQSICSSLKCSKRADLICFNLARILTEMCLRFCEDHTKESMIDAVSKIYDAVVEDKKERENDYRNKS